MSLEQIQPDASYPDGVWPEIDPRLLGEARSVPPAFPLDLLPGRWRAWVEAPAHSFIPLDYLAQAMLGGVAGVCGAGTLVRVNAHWTEPLVLWLALVGGPSTGKAAAFARIRPLLEAVTPPQGCRDRAGPTVLPDGAMKQLSFALSDSSRGVVIWRPDLADWLVDASGRLERSRWLAAWNAGDAIPRDHVVPPRERQYLAATLLGGLRPDRLAETLDRCDSALAARILYVWPEDRTPIALAGAPADDEAVHAMLQRIADFGGAPQNPGVMPLTPEAVGRLEELAADLHRQRRETDGLEAEWIAKAVPMIVRFAGLLALMHWAEAEPRDGVWPRVELRHLEDAHALWHSYFLPHATGLFGWAGSSRCLRLARRAIRWLKNEGATEVSREMIRRDALARSINAAETDDVIALLEAGGALRRIATEKPDRGPAPRRWAVNPALW